MESFKIISKSDLDEIRKSSHPERYFIGGTVDFNHNQLILIRGNLEIVKISLDWFQSTINPPNFQKFKIIDCGQTIKFGQYEAASDSLLDHQYN